MNDCRSCSHNCQKIRAATDFDKLPEETHEHLVVTRTVETGLIRDDLLTLLVVSVLVVTP